jgi:hypothetical protein
MEEEQNGETDATPEPVVVTVTEAHSAVVLIWDKAGNAWLVPGYILIGDQGWLTPVFALEEGVVALPDLETSEVSPMVK